MTINAAGGTPQYSGTFVPEIWSGRILVKFYANTVIPAISNRDYEGEIKDKNDKVIIRTGPDMVIRKYSKGQNLIIDRPEAPNVELEINKAYYFNAICDDIDKYQSDLNLLDIWSADAGQQMKIEVDTEFLASVYADAHADNKGSSAGAKSGDIDLGVTGSPVTVTKVSILDLIVDCDTVLDEQNVPEENRWFVIPPWMRGMIMKSDLKDASLTGDGQSILRNGRIGRIGNFTLYVSNLLTSVTDSSNKCWHAMAGQKNAISFAAQMVKMETLRPESTFGTLIRGLNVLGYKTLKEEALVDIYCLKGGN